jgi:hypothetical protein
MGRSQLVLVWVEPTPHKVAPDPGPAGVTYHISTKNGPIAFKPGVSVPSMGAICFHMSVAQGRSEVVEL